MDLSALESAVKALETSLDSVETWITISTVLVVIGLVIEYWFPLKQLIADIRKRPPFPWKLVAEMVGGVLVTVGVAGEFWFQSRASTIQTFIRSDSHQIEALLDQKAADADREGATARKEAGQANERAAKLEKENLLLQQKLGKLAWRTITKEQQLLLDEILIPFAGQGFITMWLGEDEPGDFANKLRLSLLSSKWKGGLYIATTFDLREFKTQISRAKELPGDDAAVTGVFVILNNPPESTDKAADALVSWLKKQGFGPSKISHHGSAAVITPSPKTIAVLVGRRP